MSRKLVFNCPLNIGSDSLFCCVGLFDGCCLLWHIVILPHNLPIKKMCWPSSFLTLCVLFNLFPRSVTVCSCPCYWLCLSGPLRAPSRMNSDPLRSICETYTKPSAHGVEAEWGAGTTTKPAFCSPNQSSFFNNVINTSRAIGLLWSWLCPQSVVIHHRFLWVLAKRFIGRVSPCHSCVDCHLSLHCL